MPAPSSLACVLASAVWPYRFSEASTASSLLAWGKGEDLGNVDCEAKATFKRPCALISTCLFADLKCSVCLA